MDVCAEKIQQQRLTPEILECIKAYIFTAEVARIAETELLKGSPATNGDPSPWMEIEVLCSNMIIECSEVLGLTPVDRKNLGLL